MPRRGENIRKRKDGRWEARYIKGYREDGTARYGSLYAKSYAEAKEKKAAALAQTSLPRGADACMPVVFDSIITEWLSCQRHSVKEPTYLHYRRLADTHIRPELGGVRVRQFTQETLGRNVDHKFTWGRLDGTGGLSVKDGAGLIGPCAADHRLRRRKGIYGPRHGQKPQKGQHGNSNSVPAGSGAPGALPEQRSGRRLPLRRLSVPVHWPADRGGLRAAVGRHPGLTAERSRFGAPSSGWRRQTRWPPGKPKF